MSLSQSLLNITATLRRAFSDPDSYSTDGNVIVSQSGDKPRFDLNWNGVFDAPSDVPANPNAVALQSALNTNFVEVEYPAEYYGGGGAMTLESRSFTKILFPSVNQDAGGLWNATTKDYVAPVDGIYVCNMFFRVVDATAAAAAAPGTGFGIGLTLNGIPDANHIYWDMVKNTRSSTFFVRTIGVAAGTQIGVCYYWDSDNASQAGALVGIYRT